MKRAALVLTILTAGCGSTPVSPSPTQTTQTTVTPAIINTPPRITTVYAIGSRIEAGDSLELVADVQDDETPVEQLNYQWSSDKTGGGFSPIDGNPRHVRWLAPNKQNPGLSAFTLTVTESYQDGAQTKQNVVSSTTQPVHYNDSIFDIMTISSRFLTVLFPDFSVPAAVAVQDFSDSCTGKADELGDVADNRVDVHILSGTYSNVSVTVNPSKDFADVSGTCVFRDIPNSGPLAGHTERVTGTCKLTAVYEQWNWRLCQSNFFALNDPVPENLQSRVPGRIR